MTEYDDIREPEPPRAGRFGAMGLGVRLLGRQTLAIAGLIMVILSVPIGFLTPFLPIGLPIGIFGAALLTRNSVWGQRFIGHIVRKYPAAERITPNWLVKFVLGRDKRPDV